jgi:uncharacterized RDD family membrane protein YckC
MDALRINTTQNVALSYTAAGVGPRMLAGLMDAIFVYAYIAILSFIFGMVVQRSIYSQSYSNDSYNQVMMGIFLLCLLPAIFYNLLTETFFHGQSFGKKIMKIKVVKIDGSQPGFGSYLVRSIFRLIDIMTLSPGVAIITIAVSKNSQRFGDMIAGTTVIQMNRPVSIRETILNVQKPDYQIVYPQVSLMSDADANIIREVLDFSIAQNQPRHLSMLSQKIKSKYGITDVRQNDAQFLNTLLMDYSHYQFEK